MNFYDWVRKTPMTDIGALVNQFLIVIATIWMLENMNDLLHTGPAEYLREVKTQLTLPTAGNSPTEGASAAALAITAILSAANTHIASAHNMGLQIAYVILAILGVKLTATTVAHGVNRGTAQERYRAQAEIEREKRGNGVSTREHPAVVMENVQKVEAKIGGSDADAGDEK